MHKLMDLKMQAFVLWEEVSRDPSKKFEYEARRKAILDHYSVLRDAELREKRAAEQGLAKGIAKGLAKGNAEGRIEEKKQLAKKLLAIGMDEGKILELTELSATELEELKKSIH
ncbi:hypothetical protein [Tumebacillus permanentifrigoris]|uniref:Putative transposase/invertase (TIGR01784 family) n=1 Tax=Tumebacillus permanentifrigoris TaxID=378543 RepID=A0A316D9Z6_9BACL|nr:hypothetical protein [Tumebacillus permanentifrigoris]PWK13178.1 putative transposase/invertase (TIGR01784 family) [Tumebacillus permanentifrigoris]